VDALHGGNYLHDAMQAFAQLLHERYPTYDLGAQGDDAALALMDEVTHALDDTFAYGLLQSSARMRFNATLLHRVAQNTAQTYLADVRASAYRPLLPVGWEVVFGRGAAPAVPLVQDGGTVLLEGRIDRVDVVAGEDVDYLRVMDYKSGRADLSVLRAKNGLSMQTWLYLWALCSVWPQMAGRAALPGGAFLVPLKDPWLPMGPAETAQAEKQKNLRPVGWLRDEEPARSAGDFALRTGEKSARLAPGRGNSGLLLPPGEVDALINTVRDNARAAVHSIRAGKMPPRPVQGEEACAWCRWRHVCGRGPQDVRVLQREAAQTTHTADAATEV